MLIDIKGAIIPNDEKWIYDFYEIESTCPNDVKTKLNEANGDDVEIRINSSGGSVFDGSEIYSAIRSYKGDVKIVIEGLAASAASVIACAGYSEIAPTGMMMIHNVACGGSGDYHDFEKQADILKKANEAVASAYVEKAGVSMEDALSLMDEETWFSAEDCVSYGLVDKITESQNLKLTASFSNGLIPSRIIEKMQNDRAEEKAQRRAECKARFEKLRNGGVQVDE